MGRTKKKPGPKRKTKAATPENTTETSSRIFIKTEEENESPLNELLPTNIACEIKPENGDDFYSDVSFDDSSSDLPISADNPIRNTVSGINNDTADGIGYTASKIKSEDDDYVTSSSSEEDPLMAGEENDKEMPSANSGITSQVRTCKNEPVAKLLPLVNVMKDNRGNEVYSIDGHTFRFHAIGDNGSIHIKCGQSHRTGCPGVALISKTVNAVAVIALGGSHNHGMAKSDKKSRTERKQSALTRDCPCRCLPSKSAPTKRKSELPLRLTERHFMGNSSIIENRERCNAESSIIPLISPLTIRKKPLNEIIILCSDSDSGADDHVPFEHGHSINLESSESSDEENSGLNINENCVESPESVRGSLKRVAKSKNTKTPVNPSLDIREEDGSDYICDDEPSSSPETIPKKMVTRNMMPYQAAETSSPNFKADDTLSNNEKKIEKPKKTNRTWDRKNACVYCERLVTNFTRHLKRHHPNETEVLKYMSIADSDPKIKKKKRQDITDELRNRGNFVYNSKVCSEKEGELLPNRRNMQDKMATPSSFVICKTCLGTFKRTTFYRHKKCGRDGEEKREDMPENYKKRVISTQSLSIMPKLSSASRELQENILPMLRNDEISLLIKYDPLIISFGSMLLKKKKERRCHKGICSKMRDLATLLDIVSKKDPDVKQLKDVLDPKKYALFIDGVREMCGINESTGRVNVPSIPARLRPSIIGCIEILYTDSIMTEDISTAHPDDVKKNLHNFKTLLKSNWQWEVSPDAEKTRTESLTTKAVVLPLDEDTKKVMVKVHSLEEKYYHELNQDITILNYENLCEVTIVHIILLDRERSGDVAEAELSFYVNRKRDEIPLDVIKLLDLEQRDAITDLDVFQIPGKRVRAVPVLLTDVMRQNIDLIVSCREPLNIPSSNAYLFARPLTAEPFDGGKCLSRIKDMRNLIDSKMLTATVSQVHANQNDQYTEDLADLIEHEVQAIQKGVVASELLAIENTSSDLKITAEIIKDKVVPVLKIDADMLDRDTKIKVKRRLRLSSDTTRENDDFEEEKKERKRWKKVHVKWTEEEVQIVKKYFTENITMKKNPGKAKCLKVLKTEPRLHKRSWEQLNTYVNNIYKNKLKNV